MSIRTIGLIALWLVVTVAIGAFWGLLRQHGMSEAITVPASAACGSIWTFCLILVSYRP